VFLKTLGGSFIVTIVALGLAQIHGVPTAAVLSLIFGIALCSSIIWNKRVGTDELTNELATIK